MKEEISFAVEFLKGELQSYFDEEELSRFLNNLLEAMTNRFQNHWHPDRPLKGNAFRCLNIEEGRLDPVLHDVVASSGLSVSLFARVFPHGLALWIDPNDVSYRMGKGSISPIYRRFDKPSPKPTSLNANSPSFTPRSDSKVRIPDSSHSLSGIHARFSPPPGFTHLQTSNGGRFSPSRVADIGLEFPATTWSNTTLSSAWNDKRLILDAFNDMDNRQCSLDRGMGFQNFPRSVGWKTGRKGKSMWNTNLPAGNSTSKLDRFHWYKDELSSMMEKQNFELQGIPQEVY